MRSKEGQAAKMERDRQRAAARITPGKPLRFMGQEFATANELRAAYPAFAGDDCIRAMRDGCETVIEVEKHCWQHKNSAYIKAVQAAQRSVYSARHSLGKLKSKKKGQTA